MQAIEIVDGHITEASCPGARHASKLIVGSGGSVPSIAQFQCSAADRQISGSVANLCEGLGIQNQDLLTRPKIDNKKY